MTRRLFKCRLCWKVMAIFIIFFIILASISSYFIGYHYELDMLNDEHDIAENIIKAYVGNAALNKITLPSNSPIVGLKVLDAKGNTLRELGETTQKKYIDLRIDPPQKSISGDHYLDVAFPLILHDKMYHIIARTDILKTQARTNNFFFYLKEINVITLLFLGLIILLVVRWLILSPLISIIESVRSAKQNPENSSHYKITKIANDEIGELSQEINRLLDISQQHYDLLGNEIKQLKHFDPQTKVPNQAHFNKLLEQQLDTRPLWVCNFHFHNISAFQKTLSDTDRGLLHNSIVSRINQSFQEIQLLGRIAEFEYALVCNKAPNEVIIITAIQALQKAYLGAAFTCQIGISKYPDDSKQAETLLSYARLAANNAFSQQLSHCYFKEDMNTRSTEDQQLLGDIETAIAESQFQLVFQPQYAIPKRHLIGCETLVRWQHPQYGLISPDRFIPLIEQSGMMPSFENWLITHALSLPIYRVKAGINLAASQLNQQTIDLIISCCEKNSINPHLVTIEITESSLIHNINSSKSLLQQLKTRGFIIAVDDFGTGYSSLSYLQTLPINMIKIDRSFIQDIHKNTQNETIVKHVIDMGHSLDLTIIAEGVESEPELELLIGLKCDYIQGYLLGKPMSLDEYLNVIEENHE